MKIERALKIRDGAVMSLRDLYSRAASFGMTSQAINDSVSRILAEMPPKTPEWVRAYFDGYRKCLTDKLYESNLVYGGYIGDEFHSTHRTRPDYYEAKGVGACDFATGGKVHNLGHYWAHDTRKPFFIG